MSLSMGSYVPPTKLNYKGEGFKSFKILSASMVESLDISDRQAGIRKLRNRTNHTFWSKVSPSLIQRLFFFLYRSNAAE